MTVIDAKERPISVTSTSSRIYVCPDKWPDAISQLANSGGLTINLPSGAGGSLNAATAEQATSLAFRTQVTETQQVFLYFLCQLNANKTMSDDQVTTEMRHYQNTLLAMLAVEELTSPGRAGAAAATDTSSEPKADGTTTSPTAPNPSDPKVTATQSDSTAVTNAVNALNTAGKAVNTAESTLVAETNLANVKSDAKQFSNDLSTYIAKEKNYSSDVTKFATDVKALPGAGNPPAAVTQAQAALTTDAKTVSTDQKNMAAAVKNLQTATDATGLKSAQASFKTVYDTYTTDDADYTKSLNSLQQGAASWNTQTVGKPAAGTTTTDGKKSTGSSNASVPAVTPDVANAVAVIVQTVVWQSFITEDCLDALFHPKPNTELSEDLREFCKTHLQEADRFRFAQLGLNMDNNQNFSVIPGLNASPGAGKGGGAQNPPAAARVAGPTPVPMPLTSGRLAPTDIATPLPASSPVPKK